MHFQKKVLAEIEKCYAAAAFMVNQEPYFIYAGEGQGSIHLFRGENFSEHVVLAQGNGGTMSIVPVPERPGWFFVSRGFYSMIKSEHSVIELFRLKDGQYEPPLKVASLPYLHRFGLIHGRDGTSYLVAASILSHQNPDAVTADWSQPGHVYYAVLPQNLDQNFSLEFKAFDGDFYVNHGFCTHIFHGCETAFTASREGVFSWTPPKTPDGTWISQKLLSMPVSDIAVEDIDGDGEPELAVLMPFHGDQCKVFHKSEDGYHEIFSSPEHNDFYHVIISAALQGRNVFIGGARKGVMDLFILAFDQEQNEVILEHIDTGVGPSNAAVINLPDKDIVLSANRMIAQAAYYTLERNIHT